MEITKYKIEQINVSDDEYTLTSINVENGQFIKEGHELFSYESSKSNFEVIAEKDGIAYIKNSIKLNDIVKVAELVLVTSKVNLDKKKLNDLFNYSPKTIKTNNDILITKKARKLIKEHKIKTNNLIHKNNIITEENVKDYISSLHLPLSSQDINYYYQDLEKINFKINTSQKNNTKKIALIGAGLSFLQVLHIINQHDKKITAVYDDNISIIGRKIIGIDIKNQIDFDLLLSDYKNQLFDEIIVSFSGDISSRKYIFKRLQDLKIPITNLIDKSAIISPYTNIGIGNIIFGNVLISSFTEIGDNNFISAFCNIEHHNILGSHNTFGPGVMTSGSCTIENECKFGTGVFIEPRIKINSKCILASGTIIQKNINSGTLVRNLAKNEYKKII